MREPTSLQIPTADDPQEELRIDFGSDAKSRYVWLEVCYPEDNLPLVLNAEEARASAHVLLDIADWIEKKGEYAE